MEGAATTHPAAVPRAADRATTRAWALGGLALAVWAALIVVSHLWGTAINDAGSRMRLGAPPLFGELDLRLDGRAVIPVAVATAIVLVAPLVSRSASWRVLLGCGGVGALVWALALALTVGPQGIVEPLDSPNEYLTQVPLIGSPGEFLSTFTERIDGFAQHVRSHPPGMVLALWSLDAIGLDGAWPAALLTVAIAASAVPAALIAMRAVAGEDASRRAAPFLVLAPAAVWVATTADALYMGVGAWAVATSVLAITADGRRSDLLAATGGLLFGACAFLSYGLVLLAAIPLAVAISRARVRPLLLAAAMVGLVMVAFAAAGFWWLEGYSAIREQYFASVARHRPYDFFLLNNLAAFALAVGPVAAVALVRLRDCGAWLLVGGAAAAVLAADLSGMSKAEVERIWLPFLPWVLLATAALPARRAWGGALLALQAGCGIAIQLGVRTIW